MKVLHQQLFQLNPSFIFAYVKDPHGIYYHAKISRYYRFDIQYGIIESVLLLTTMTLLLLTYLYKLHEFIFQPPKQSPLISFELSLPSDIFLSDKHQG
jgi:hypothetical protein